jgi:hypothetical protein
VRGVQELHAHSRVGPRARGRDADNRAGRQRFASRSLADGHGRRFHGSRHPSRIRPRTLTDRESSSGYRVREVGP